MTPNEALPPAAKFSRIAAEIKANADWRALLAGTGADVLAALDEIAKRYSGENTNTGGGIYVVLIALTPHDVMAVSSEAMSRYHDDELTDPYDIFSKPENFVRESAISLVD
jgi:hypothetical protein